MGMANWDVRDLFLNELYPKKAPASRVAPDGLPLEVGTKLTSGLTFKFNDTYYPVGTEATIGSFEDVSEDVCYVTLKLLDGTCIVDSTNDLFVLWRRPPKADPPKAPAKSAWQVLMADE